MASKPRLQPGPDHPITVTPTSEHIVVTVAGKVVADTTSAVKLQEASYPPVHYIPLSDVDQSLLERTSTESYCPYKGDASYYSIPAGGAKSVDAIWEYQNPYEPVAAIQGHVAFYPNRVDSIEIS